MNNLTPLWTKFGSIAKDSDILLFLVLKVIFLSLFKGSNSENLNFDVYELAKHRQVNLLLGTCLDLEELKKNLEVYEGRRRKD